MISIRPGTPADAPGVAACVDRVARERRYLAIVEGFAIDETARFITRLLDAGGVHLVAEGDDGEIVGACDIAPLATEGMRHVGRLGIAVLPGYRRRGLGRQLLREAERRARGAGAARIELASGSQRTDAHQFYKACGYSDGTVRFIKRLGDA